MLAETIRQVRAQSQKAIADLEREQRALERDIARRSKVLRRHVVAAPEFKGADVARQRDELRRLEVRLTEVRERHLALSRYGGLRCPSEHIALRWEDVDWARNRLTIRSPKTEHHPNGASRQIPLFPELLPHLRQAFEEAEAHSRAPVAGVLVDLGLFKVQKIAFGELVLTQKSRRHDFRARSFRVGVDKTPLRGLLEATSCAPGRIHPAV